MAHLTTRNSARSFVKSNVLIEFWDERANFVQVCFGGVGSGGPGDAQKRFEGVTSGNKHLGHFEILFSETWKLLLVYKSQKIAGKLRVEVRQVQSVKGGPKEDAVADFGLNQEGKRSLNDDSC